MIDLCNADLTTSSKTYWLHWTAGETMEQRHDKIHDPAAWAASGMVAHELGFFAKEGLDYEIAGGNIGQTKRIDASGQLLNVRSGAYQSHERGNGNKGEKSDISCACLPDDGRRTKY